MFATDPLSLVFLACVVFSGAFLVIASVSGMGHSLHVGAHTFHVGAHMHVPHIASHGATVHNGQIHAHTAHGIHASSTPAAQSGTDVGGTHVSPLSAVTSAFAGSLNVYSLLILLLIFGLVGYLLHVSTNLGDVLTIVLALLAGDGAAITTGLVLTRIFIQGSGEALTHDNSRLEGRIGTVSMAIRTGGIGEVLFPAASGGRQSIGARGIDGEAIPTGTEVVILSTRDGIATVQSWESFMAGVRAGTAPELQPIDLP